MQSIKLGILKETKTPPDRRVPLTPEQCAEVIEKFPNVSIKIQSSSIRAYNDAEYRVAGFDVVENVEDCDILMGVKEVKIDKLIPNKKYFFFSHTIKKQPYNRGLLQAIIDKKIQLIDYETLTDKNHHRIIGFGRYAGIVGCYNGFLAFGKKKELYDLLPANKCHDRKELDEELNKVKLPSTTRIVVTGTGRVGHGAHEILEVLGIKEVSPESFLMNEFEEPVFTQLDVEDYYAREDGAPFNKAAFFKDGSGHHCTFKHYLKRADLYIACHYWKSGSPNILTREDLLDPEVTISVIADISCDIAGPIASTIRPSTIEDPLYGYDPQSGQEVDFMEKDAIGVMAVDNLPCELPRDASEGFGRDLIERVFPALFGEDPDRIIERASETNLNGELTENYSYLKSYLEGN